MKRVSLDLYTDISGNTIKCHTYEFGKGKPTVYIQGGMHGGEITFFVIEKLFHWLIKNEAKLTGKVTLVPIVNPPSWNQRIYYYTMGKFSFYKGKDWNISFPGNSTTLQSHIASVIYNTAKNFEVCIDLHTARTSKPYTIFIGKHLLPFVQLIGLPYNHYFPTSDLESKPELEFDEVMTRDGKQALTLECGAHDSFDEENIDEVLSCLKRVISTYTLPKSTLTSKSPQKQVSYFERIEVLYSKTSGFIHYHVKPRDIVKKGDPLCTIYKSSSLGDKTIIKAPYNALVFELQRTHISWVGDELFRLVPQTVVTSILQ